MQPAPHRSVGLALRVNAPSWWRGGLYQWYKQNQHNPDTITLCHLGADPEDSANFAIVLVQPDLGSLADHPEPDMPFFGELVEILAGGEHKMIIGLTREMLLVRITNEEET